MQEANAWLSRHIDKFLLSEVASTSYPRLLQGLLEGLPSVCLYLSLSVCLSVCLSILPVSVCLSLSLSSGDSLVLFYAILAVIEVQETTLCWGSPHFPVFHFPVLPFELGEV